MADLYQPKPADRFTFGLWTVGNPGRDPFGDVVRLPLKPTYSVQKLSELGAYGINLHDNDLVPFDASASERDQIVKEFKQALDDYGMKVPMATTNLFYHPVFKDGAFTSNDPNVRAFALQKTMNAIDLGVELGATIYVFWGGREGAEVDAAKHGPDTIKWNREAMNFLTDYVKDQGYDMRFALEAKPNEPRGDLYLPTTGHMLHFIETLDHPEMVGVNPEFAHETMAGLNFVHGVVQAYEAGKLFHIDLNDQKMSRFDQDLRFGSENIKPAFFLVKFLEDANWEGSRHFDAHAYRTEDEQGVWDFAAGCMRSYLILKEKARRFNADAEIQGLLAEMRAQDAELEELMSTYSPENAGQLRARDFKPNELGAKGLRYEKLDQLTFEILTGVR
ncbi:MAG: xylose isomerase [Candidatus Poribacteria bacterium]|nr:xylose isomerase [Candidatus Poribacteria bacterium]